MRVAVVGSFSSERYRWPAKGNKDEFDEACRALGTILAKDGHELFVQHDRHEAADWSVVAGYLDEAKSRTNPSQRISVWCPADTTDSTFLSLARQYRTLFSLESDGASEWESARFKMCYVADFTIMIGGRARSETTGYMVLAASKVLIPIASFGGAASFLLSELEKRFLGARPLPTPLTAPQLKELWSESLLERVRRSLEHAQPQVVLIHGRNLDAANAVKEFVTKSLGWTATRVMLLEYNPGETLPQKWERLASPDDTIAIAIASADDLGRYKDEDRLKRRARQNVWLEIGWFWGKYRGQHRLLILPQSTECNPLEIPNDLSGVEMFYWETSPLERRDAITQFLASFWRDAS